MGWTCEVMKETEGAQDNKTIIPASELRSLSKLRFVAEIAVCGIHKQIPLKCSRSQMFFKVGVLRNFPIFTGKHLFLQNTSGRLLTPFFWLGIIVFLYLLGLMVTTWEVFIINIGFGIIETHYFLEQQTSKVQGLTLKIVAKFCLQYTFYNPRNG